MAAKEIGRLLVTFDPDSDYPSSMTGFNLGGRRGYVITLNGRGKPLSRNEAQTLLAHELGHFVACITGDDSHDNASNREFMTTNNGQAVLPAERKAWEIAHLIKPNLDTQLERDGLESYENSGPQDFLYRSNYPLLTAQDETRANKVLRVCYGLFIACLSALYAVVTRLVEVR